MAFYRRLHALASRGVGLLVLVAVIAMLMGMAGLWMVERELIASAGESLALGAIDVAGKLDAQVGERLGDLEVLASAPQLRSSDPTLVHAHLETVQHAYPMYARLTMADRTGRVLASTDHELAGRDVRQSSWFQAIWHRPGAYVAPVIDAEGQQGLAAVVFSAPIKGADGTFQGVIMTEVDRGYWRKLVSDTVDQFGVQAQHFGLVRYRVLDSSGEMLLTFEEEGGLPGNLRQLGLPSAVRVAANRPGWIEEEHLMRKVPIITGYARMRGVGNSEALQWGILVRADRQEVLASIQGILLKLAVTGCAAFVPLVGLVAWANVRQRQEEEKSAQARQAMAESESRTRMILDNAMDAVIVMNTQGLIVGWNKQAERILGWPMQEVMGQHLGTRIVPPHHRDAHNRGLARYLTTGESSLFNKRIEITALRKDGTEIPVELTITPLQTDQGMLFSAFLRDITVRKQMVEQLNEREMFYRLLSEQLPVGVFEVNASGACVYTNKMWEMIVHGHRGLAGSQSLVAVPSEPWTQWFHMDDRPAIEAAWAKTTSAYLPIQHECRLAGGGEEAQWVQVLLWPMVTETGVRYLGTIEDITVRKRTIAHTMQLLREGRFELQTLSEAKHLSELLAYAFPDPARAQLGITELLVNGVEHGNLDISYDEKTRLLEQGKLDEELARRLALPDYARRRVCVTTVRTGTELTLAIVDEGKGFDWSPYLDPGQESSGGSHGRGIAMSKLISFDHLEYRDRGNHVVVTTRLAGPPAGSDAPEQAQAA